MHGNGERSCIAHRTGALGRRPGGLDELFRNCELLVRLGADATLPDDVHGRLLEQKRFAEEPSLPPIIPDLWSPIPRTAATFVLHLNSGVALNGDDEIDLGHLPSRTGQKMELAISDREGLAAGTLARLQAAGWSIRDANAMSRDADWHRHYLCSARGEVVPPRTASATLDRRPFSGRSAASLAAGRPVVMHHSLACGIKSQGAC